MGSSTAKRDVNGLQNITDEPTGTILDHVPENRAYDRRAAISAKSTKSHEDPTRSRSGSQNHRSSKFESYLAKNLQTKFPVVLPAEPKRKEPAEESEHMDDDKHEPGKGDSTEADRSNQEGMTSRTAVEPEVEDWKQIGIFGEHVVEVWEKTTTLDDSQETKTTTLQLRCKKGTTKVTEFSHECGVGEFLYAFGQGHFLIYCYAEKPTLRIYHLQKYVSEDPASTETRFQDVEVRLDSEETIQKVEFVGDDKKADDRFVLTDCKDRPCKIYLDELPKPQTIKFRNS